MSLKEEQKIEEDRFREEHRKKMTILQTELQEEKQKERTKIEEQNKKELDNIKEEMTEQLKKVSFFEFSEFKPVLLVIKTG